MPAARFYQLWGIVSFIGAALVVGLNYWPPTAAYQSVSWLSFALFALLMIPLFYGSKRAVASTNKSRFVQYAMLVSMFKMGLCIAILLAYALMVKPDSRWFALPVLGLYAWFTVFEVYFMLKVSRE